MAFTIEASVDPQVYVSEKEERDPYVLENYHIPDGTTPNLETYMYYAKIQRDKEALSAKNDTEDGLWGGLFSRKSTRSQESDRRSVASANSDGKNVTPPSNEGGAALVTADEYRAASGALRTATWGSVFYLITTDILGPYSTPWAFQQVGYGPGVACFFVFGIMAAYGGFILWRLFLKLDSERYPVKSFGELGQRIYGRWFGNLCNILQSLQLVFNVGIIILQNGQGLSQMAKFRLCFSVCNVVWTLAGMFLGQIRTLQKFGSIANLAIWLNITVLIMTMAFAANSPPNYTASTLPIGPVITQAINVQAFENQLNGIMQIVFSYGGAMIFVEFMAEMRRPMDFWKAMAYSQIFIFIVYMFFGLFVYSYQGQYVVNPANQGISTYGLQTAGNAISLTAGIIAAALYGNIGVKIIYNNIFVAMFDFPKLTATRGKYYFALFVIVYWAIAFVIASAIPQFSALSSLIAAVCIFQFTYTFPPFMIMGYFLQVDASKDDGEFDINNPYAHRVDSWKDISRWNRAFFSNTWHFFFAAWNFLLTLACLACAILSAYSAVNTIVTAFQSSSSAAFSCHSPLDVSG
ncbi:transmembrane amino acid transporter protein-domain-containing protein [Suillus fuscotomentosus]|uniref:Transmembrane amino acid transporter protein-domain-containing protein n=1 Tax=Suillus fuscotomentosus TaxID=1912939 RepID=A0AAD4E1W9_9AGAM|nr:transmembrane amino acid transporter protein-domain-containing protein [Suillus fuscotomentosus]KAG1897827.1 transmembrane amino acid transporter protein-domain-containing protein [Suillus fuscotomentosus]